MASTDDILATQKNGVLAINEYTSTLAKLAGTNNTKEIAAATTQQVKIGKGWLANISVIVAGTTTGTVYDSSNTNSLTGLRIYIIPNTVGITQIQVPFADGLVITTGTGQVASVTYT
jgi:hypothetical protein